MLHLARGQAMRSAIARLNAGSVVEAETIVRQRLAADPTDVAALCMLGDLAARAGIHAEAEQLFRRALAEQPAFAEAQVNLAKLLALRDGVEEAIAILDDVAADAPDDMAVALMRTALLGQIGDYGRAAALLDALAARHPRRPDVWVALGNLRNTLGDAAASVSAYRRATDLDPGNGEAWWGLANLKTYRFADEEIDRLARLASAGGTRSFRTAQIDFALGKALEDRDEAERSFAHYAAGNTARRHLVGYDADATAAEVDRSIAFFSPDRVGALAGSGHPSDEPIFIVGMPRSGSTLVEQIVASHPQVEGTAELPYVPMLVHRLLAERWRDRGLTFPQVLASVPRERFRELGAAYLAAARVHRREGKRHFIDKLPNNWLYVGFLKLMLPNAKIIDTRREAMACCWSNFRQWFSRGQDFSYDLVDVGRYYRDYVRHAAHMDAVLPGEIRRVELEPLLADPERSIRDLLDGIGLPFDAACLRFHENRRAVRTASAQQVRRPIQQPPIEPWRAFERHLGPLKAALGDLAADRG